MAYHGPVSTMNSGRPPYQFTDQIDNWFTHARTRTLPLCRPFAIPQYIPDVIQQYHTQPVYFSATLATASVDQFTPHAHVATAHRPQEGARLVNGIFIPNVIDIARGRINQAVYEARFNHQYTDNTTKAEQARHVFDKYFGTDAKSLLAWQDMSFFCGRDPQDMSTTIRECKIFLRNKYVNIFDFITAVDEFMSNQVKDRAYVVNIPTFANARKLEQYSREKGLICPAKTGRGNDLFRFMLTKWF